MENNVLYKINELVWTETRKDKWVSRTPVGTFYLEYAEYHSKKSQWWCCSNMTNSYKHVMLNLDMAKVDAQLAYEKMVKRALIPFEISVSKNGDLEISKISKYDEVLDELDNESELDCVDKLDNELIKEVE